MIWCGLSSGIETEGSIPMWEGGLGPARPRGADTGLGGNLISDCFHVAWSRYGGLGVRFCARLTLGEGN